MTATRSNPEARLQISVKTYLGWCLPPSILWTASLAGHGKMTRFGAAKAKAMGLKRGFPDLQFLFPDGVTRYIELKSPTGSLSDDQKTFRDFAAKTGQQIFAVCRSLDEVEAVLRGWGAPMRAHPFNGVSWEAAEASAPP